MSQRSIQAGKAVIVVDIVDKANASFQRLTSRMMKASRALRDIGTNAAGATLLTGLASGNVLSRFMKFEDQMLSLSAKMGYFGVVTQKQQAILDDLKNTIIDLGKQTSYTSAEVADAAISLAQAGFSADEIKASLQSVLDLARGTGYALGDSADLLANAIRTFDLFGQNDSLETRMQKINQVASQFVKATRLGTIEIEDLRESLKYASGSAHNLGVSLPVVLGFLVQMSESGLKASLAGTSLNTALLNMIKNSDKLKKTFPSFNITTDKNGNMDMMKTFQDLMQLTSRMSKIQKVDLFGDIFNIRGARMVSSVQEMERVEGFIKSISLAGQEARLSAAKMESGLGGAFRRATSAVEAFEIAIGYAFKKPATALFNFATVAVDMLEKLTDKHKILIGTFLLSPAIFGAVAIGALSLSFILARLTTVVTMLGMAMKGISNRAGAAFKTIGMGLSPIAAIGKARQARAGAIATQTAKVAKLQAGVTLAYQKAGIRKAAILRVANSKRVANLLAAQTKLQEMKSATIAGRVRGGASAIAGGAKATAGRASLVAQTMQEKAFYKRRVALYTNAASNMAKKQRYYTTLGKIIQARGVGDPRAAFAAAAKARAARAMYAGKAANAGSLLKNVSVMKTLFQGASFAKTFAAMAKGVGSILQLSMGFLKLSMSVTRFVFSWNFVGLAFNALLLFGHKIPVIANAFKALGNGVSDAFGQIAAIAKYAQPAIDLFTLAFNAFVEGDTATGIDALYTGFSGLVSIIQNQLNAAWNAFMANVEYIWITLKQIGTTIMVMVQGIIDGVMTIGTAITGRAFQGLGDILGGGTGGGVMAWVQTAGIVFNTFVTELTKSFVTFNEFALSFLDKMQIVFGEIISHIPGTLNAGSTLAEKGRVNSMTTSLQASQLRASATQEGKLREQTLNKVFKESADAAQQQRIQNVDQSNMGSHNTALGMQGVLKQLSDNFSNNMMARNQQMLADMAAQGQVSPTMSASAQASPEITLFTSKLESLVGSVTATRNLYKVDSASTLKEQQTTNEKLDELISAVKTGAAF